MSHSNNLNVDTKNTMGGVMSNTNKNVYNTNNGYNNLSRRNTLSAPEKTGNVVGAANMYNDMVDGMIDKHLYNIKLVDSKDGADMLYTGVLIYGRIISQIFTLTLQIVGLFLIYKSFSSKRYEQTEATITKVRPLVLSFYVSYDVSIQYTYKNKKYNKLVRLNNPTEEGHKLLITFDTEDPLNVCQSFCSNNDMINFIVGFVMVLGASMLFTRASSPYLQLNVVDGLFALLSVFGALLNWNTLMV